MTLLNSNAVSEDGQREIDDVLTLMLSVRMDRGR